MGKRVPLRRRSNEMCLGSAFSARVRSLIPEYLSRRSKGIRFVFVVFSLRSSLMVCFTTEAFWSKVGVFKTAR